MLDLCLELDFSHPLGGSRDPLAHGREVQPVGKVAESHEVHGPLAGSFLLSKRPLANRSQGEGLPSGLPNPSVLPMGCSCACLWYVCVKCV